MPVPNLAGPAALSARNPLHLLIAGATVCALVLTLLVVTRAEAGPTYTLQVSSSAYRSGSSSLDGATVSGNAYVSATYDKDVTQVDFYLDDPSMSRAPVRTDRYAPFDLTGGYGGSARAFDTTQLPDGRHTLTARLAVGKAGSTVIQSTFQVSNHPEHSLRYSSDPLRSGGVVLDGARITQPVFVFIDPAADDHLNRVDFRVDGTTVRSETWAPFDLAGSADNAPYAAYPWDISKLPAGSHVVSATITNDVGQTYTVTSTVAVQPSGTAVTTQPPAPTTTTTRPAQTTTTTRPTTTTTRPSTTTTTRPATTTTTRPATTTTTRPATTTTTTRPAPTTTTTRPAPTTTTTRPAPTTTTTAGDVGGSAGGGGSWPSASNTGVSGSLTPYTGTYRVTQAGAVVQNMDITGQLWIDAENVTVRNVRIRANGFMGIRAFEHGGTLIENVEVDGLSNTSNDSCINLGSPDASRPAIVRRANVHHCVDGFKMGSNSRIESSFMHDLTGGNGAHNDGVQIMNGSNMTLTGNHCVARTGWTSCFLLDADTGPVSGLTVDSNYFELPAGERSNVALYVSNLGGYSNTGARVRNNLFTRAGWSTVAYITVTPAEWTNNVFTDGSAVPQSR